MLAQIKKLSNITQMQSIIYVLLHIFPVILLFQHPVSQIEVCPGLMFDTPDVKESL